MEEMARWQGASAEIAFEPADFDVLDIALSLIPELRIAALVVKRARQAKINYPIDRAEVLVALLGKKRIVVAGHRIAPDDVAAYLPPEFFPIAHEGELVSRAYLGLMRCSYEVGLAAHLQAATLSKAQKLLARRAVGGA